MFLIVVFLIDRGYRKGIPTSTLPALIAVTLMLLVFCVRFHSPQYIMWFTPFLALTLADSIGGIVLFWSLQVMNYIEFPLLFGQYYTNLEYVVPGVLVFFVLYHALQAGTIYHILRHKL